MRDGYQSPLSTRYASEQMQYLFSDDCKFRTWRRLWVALAEAEQQLGLPIADEQIAQMRENIENIDYEVAAARERQVRHDVMAHVYAYGEVCPKAKGIIHLGATSCYVGDNTDVIVMREGLRLIRTKLLTVMDKLASFALQYKDLPCLAYTHFQPAQLTTVGKRAALWLNELLIDFEELEHRIDSLQLLGSKGTTGTQASFMELFDGDAEKVKRLDALIAEKMGFSGTVPVSGQTYSRKVDAYVLGVLSGIAQSASKFANDMRLLAGLKEIEEPFEKNQIGSSAMPYKRNPMRCERICALARYVIQAAVNPAVTASVQWFERTLDDSANKRIAVAEAFLAVDAILNIYINVADGIVVYPKVIAQRVKNELPFMASENIMMQAVKRGGDRQQLHEKIRAHAMEAARQVKQLGLENDLISSIAADSSFGLSRQEIEAILTPEQYTGRAPEQTEEFVLGQIQPLLEANASVLGVKPELFV